MDILDILQKIVQQLTAESDCGLCWQLVPGGRQDYLNLAKEEVNDDGDCCVLLGVLNNNFKTVYEGNTNFRHKMYRDWEVQLFAGIPSRLDIQFYNEVRPEDTENSKWVRYIQPIQCCLSQIEESICDIQNCKGDGATIEVSSFNGQMRLNYLDNNYDGWLINITIREWLNP